MIFADKAFRSVAQKLASQADKTTHILAGNRKILCNFVQTADAQPDFDLAGYRSIRFAII